MEHIKKYGETAFVILTVVAAFYVTIILMGIYNRESPSTTVDYGGFKFELMPRAVEMDTSIFIPVESILRYEGYKKTAESKTSFEYVDYNHTKLLFNVNSNRVFKNEFSYNSKSRLFVEDDILFIETSLLSKVLGKDISFKDNKLTFTEHQVKPYDWIEYSEGFIAKACGSVLGVSGENSYDALVKNYSSGYRVFEVDLTYSIDGYLVCFDNSEAGKNYINMNIEEFKQNKILNRLKPMDLETLLKLMHLNKDMYIIIDTGSLDSELSLVYGDMYREIVKLDAQISKRIIPQVYSVQDYMSLKNAYPFENVIFNASKNEYSEAEILKAMNSNNISVVMLPVDKVNKGFVTSLLENGKIVFVDYVNKPAEAEVLRKMGVEGFCTDVLMPSIE